jgi:hypothetical protein
MIDIEQNKVQCHLHVVDRNQYEIITKHYITIFYSKAIYFFTSIKFLFRIHFAYSKQTLYVICNVRWERPAA